MPGTRVRNAQSYKTLPDALDLGFICGSNINAVLSSNTWLPLPWQAQEGILAGPTWEILIAEESVHGPLLSLLPATTGMDCHASAAVARPLHPS